ncbi:hypothetical protein CDL15_Pgr028863 [Punica granatum]|uniref:Remorin C-terminal domain-containing protein n=1 Tax=Punica granatum TaxID=22663 RepID=A0A218WXF1_PUNGR|nr:hypothetical protein CDL15_Pgr028863 [Punica granatum]
MDYERIQKPQQGNGGGGALSPGKLRSILLMAADKKRRAEVEVDDSDSSNFELRSQLPPHPDDNGGSGSDSCKDVDVNVVPEFYASTAASSDAKTERAAQRASLAPFSKSLPSKWEDAQKWIASPTSNRSLTGQAKDGQGVGSRKTGLFARQLSAKVVVEVPDHRTAASGEPDTKRIDSSNECGGQRVVDWETYPNPAAEPYGKSVLMIENSIGESAINLSQHDALAIHSATTFIPPPSTARSVSMRDMGTEMTPIASQEPSRTGTPAKATTPTRSPNASRSSTPPRGPPSTSQANAFTERVDFTAELSQKELHMKTRREIMVLGTQLGKLNIAAWASKEEEENVASTSLKTDLVHQPSKNAVETRAAAWEEAEKAKYMASGRSLTNASLIRDARLWYGRMEKMEVERIRGRAHDKLMNKLAAASHKAEERRATAEARRNCQAAKTEQQVEYIRKTGRIPSSFSCWSWCS